MKNAIDPTQFKQAMRRLAGAVSVITVGTGEDRTGFTATSVTSLSAEPPRLLISVNRESSSYPIIKDYQTFGVNLLASEQEPIADRFAGRKGEKGVARFAGAHWKTLVTGAPLLQNALAAIDCRVEEIIERHSHAIIIGSIEAVDLGLISDPLLYWSGGYHTLQDLSGFLFSEAG